MKTKIIIFLTLIGLLLVGCSSQNEAPAPLIETGIDPDSWALIPAGEFYAGQHEHETAIDYDYEMMVTNVTNQQFADFLNESIKDGSTEIGRAHV